MSPVPTPLAVTTECSVRRGRWAGPLLCALAAALLVLSLTLSGCGGGEAEETPQGTEPQETTQGTGSFTQDVTAAEQGTANAASPENPSEFISLCANCHDSLDASLQWRQQRKLIFNHEVHFANGIRCVACHQEFPHKPGKTLHVSVETCFQCHGAMHGEQGKLAPTACDTCHTEDIAQVTPDHKADNWLMAAGSEKALHSQKALEQRLFCRMCHEDSFCSDCHQVEMPHPEDWTKTGHQPVAEADRSSCKQCHPQRNFCNDCHHSSLPKQPDWYRQHKSVATSQGPESCFSCHQPPFCSACHVTVGRDRGTQGE